MKNNTQKKILMGVFNPIEFDGRVKRSVESLSDEYEIIIFCPKAEINQQSELYLRAQLHRSLLNGEKIPTIVKLLLFWLQFLYLSFKYRPDIIYSHDYFLPFPGLIASKIMQSISIYDAHELIIPDLGEKKSNRDKLFYFLEKICIHEYDLIIAANEERALIMHDHYSLKKKPVSVRNISKETIGSISQEDVLDRYPDLKKRINQQFIVYMGSIDLSRGLQIIIDSLNFLPDSICLILIGDGPDRSVIKKKIENSREKRILLTGIMPQNWLQDALSLCDVGILVYGMDDLNNYYCSPNKIFEYTQAGLPVASTGQPPLVNLINKNKIGEIAGKAGEMPTANDLACSILKIFDKIDDYKKNVQEFCRKNDYKIEGKVLLKEIDNLFINEK